MPLDARRCHYDARCRDYAAAADAASLMLAIHYYADAIFATPFVSMMSPPPSSALIAALRRCASCMTYIIFRCCRFFCRHTPPLFRRCRFVFDTRLRRTPLTSLRYFAADIYRHAFTSARRCFAATMLRHADALLILFPPSTLIRAFFAYAYAYRDAAAAERRAAHYDTIAAATPPRYLRHALMLEIFDADYAARCH